MSNQSLGAVEYTPTGMTGGVTMPGGTHLPGL